MKPASPVLPTVTAHSVGSLCVLALMATTELLGTLQKWPVLVSITCHTKKQLVVLTTEWLVLCCYLLLFCGYSLCWLVVGWPVVQCCTKNQTILVTEIFVHSALLQTRSVFSFSFLGRNTKPLVPESFLTLALIWLMKCPCQLAKPNINKCTRFHE